MGRGDLGTLVRICDPAGRPRGTGFFVDHHGTVVTSHEAVDGLGRLILRAPDDRTCSAGAGSITPLPESGLALVRTEGLGGRPLPVATRSEIDPGTYVRITAGGWREARVLGPATVSHLATGRLHSLADALALAIGTEGADALRRGGQATGGPVLDTATGTVLGVLGTSLRGDRRAAGYAVPLRPVGPLAPLLRRNAATVPAYGPDLNLAAILELTATSTGPARNPDPWPEPVERPDCLREFTRFTAGDAPVLALVGAPGTGRTTALAALCVRRARGASPAPTVRLRGADLRAEDRSLADAVARALHEAGRIVTASGAPGDTTTATPERAAALAREAGRPLLVVLDGPEEMPPLLAHRLADWTATTEQWLRAHRVHLVTACRPEHWEQAGALYAPDALHRPTVPPADGLPSAVSLGPYTEAEARAVREGYGIGAEAVAEADARHPLALRLFAEVRAALPGEVPGRPGREEIFTAHLDLMCLRIAVRIAAGTRPQLRGAAVRRLAARVTGRVHEAARRCLGPGHGVLDRPSFEELFPWREGWAPAVLTEGLLVPAGAGYRFAHEELADWVQAAHLDLDAALQGLVHGHHGEPLPGEATARVDLPAQRDDGTEGPGGQLPVPRHRIGPVSQALSLLHREQGPAGLAPRLVALVEALARFAEAEEHGDGAWWAARLLRDGVQGTSDPRPYLSVLRLLADRIGARPRRHPVFAPFGPPFWLALSLGEDERIDLLRRLVPADPPPGAPPHEERVLEAVAVLLTADPRGVQPLLCRWFGDARPLPAAPHATVATAAQALLHTHRGLAVDDLCESLVATAHPLADRLLVALAEDEPSALCRAVDRWAHDDGRPERRAAAAAYGNVVARHTTTTADRELLRYAALALLARPGEENLHGAALGLLVRDPHSRPRHLPRALVDPRVPADALAAALPTHPDEALVGLRLRLYGAGEAPAAALQVLAEVDTPALARRIAALVRNYAAGHPEGARHVAAFVDRRFEDGPVARAVLFPLVTSLIRSRTAALRCALAPVLAAPGTGASRHLRAELLDVLLEHERHEAGSGDRTVLEALLRAAAEGAELRSAVRTRALVQRVGALCARTPEGARWFDRALAGAVRERPAFAAPLLTWVVAAPDDGAPLLGPEGLRALRSTGTAMPMRADSRGHGSLRPA
ncbi:trypsin-like peptidase domain-containing protein [Streptomyces sp. NPDC058872]|uniref:trypsin-like peptidase domain-containing protein n=1 Tax=Streptomyces sp. NPDC058872 TaxID=3346661 RepID=UPI0036AF4476